MKILNFGSLNLDNVYQVDHFIRPGETASANSLAINCGGKGLNQSIALARAGMNVYHAGKIGCDGEVLRQLLSSNNVNTDNILVSKERTGNAIIQVDSTGQNSILLYGGANRDIDFDQIISVLQQFGPGDYLLLQNEINNMKFIMEEAYRRRIEIILNPSPADSSLNSLPLAAVSVFLLNEIEGEFLSGKQEPKEILTELAQRYPDSCIVLTLGGDGVMCRYRNETYHQSAFVTSVVDTTAAGDTFTGYFLASYLSDGEIVKALKRASCAASLAVSRAGAAASIPYTSELDTVLSKDVS